ncbi:hypothetical protein [uncultured Abyssibacter sp.]|uniref:hypothetical protein n=1 Tax=uncultured Abyssibacter sp. TaxID=2320202 RepID=UPI0032B2CB3B
MKKLSLAALFATCLFAPMTANAIALPGLGDLPTTYCELMEFIGVDYVKECEEPGS